LAGFVLTATTDGTILAASVRIASPAVLAETSGRRRLTVRLLITTLKLTPVTPPTITLIEEPHMKLIRLVLPLFALFVVPCVLATTINVPKDQPTIQAGINAANNGDTVLVAPGKYVENINFNGKAITVTSSGGPSVTIIDGAQNGSVITFSSGETLSSLVHGFTIQNGKAVNPGGEGGGISVQNSSATITHNIIVNNEACEGDGIGVGFGSPLIRNNVITKNFDSTCGGIGGGGIGIRGASSAQILNNVISNNSTGSYGGGVALWSGNAVVIEDNFITGNVAAGNGGGISMFNEVSSVLIVQNLIKGNRAPTGNGVYWSNPAAALVNNTIIDSPRSSGGGTVSADGFCCSPMIVNNIIVALGGAMNAFVCNQVDFPANVFTFNDAFSKSGSAYGGVCTDQTGKSGNISANPKFVNPAKGDYQLRRGSRAINAGTNSAPDLPKKDLAGHRRIVGGTIDMGAYEYQGK
jgi:hypothetical protein